VAQHDERTQRKIEALEKKWEEFDLTEIREAIQFLASNRRGQKLLWRILQLGRVNTQPMAADPYATAFNCGELNVGNGVLALILDANPQIYLSMMQENEHEWSARRAELDRVVADATSDPTASGRDDDPTDYGPR
jgi:hypothetical protein